jgi:hypothetical protein
MPNKAKNITEYSLFVKNSSHLLRFGLWSTYRAASGLSFQTFFPNVLTLSFSDVLLFIHYNIAVYPLLSPLCLWFSVLYPMTALRKRFCAVFISSCVNIHCSSPEDMTNALQKCDMNCFTCLLTTYVLLLHKTLEHEVFYWVK